MIDLLGQPLTAALLGGFGGILLGLAARLGRFCTLGAIEDALYGGSTGRLRMWGLAIGLSVVGTFALHGLGFVDIDQAFYLRAGFSWPAALIGGLLFGYGMALAGTCGFGALARLGGGDIRAFVIVVVMGLTAYAALAGPLAPLRAMLFPRSAVTGTPDGYAHLLAGIGGLPVTAMGLMLGALLCLAALWSRAFLRHPASLLWSAVVACAIVSGWAATAWIAATGFAPQTLMSHTFAAPLGDTLLYTMQGSARPLSFGIGSVLGVVTGALIGTLSQGRFRWEACDDARELRRQIIGAALMGTGAVIAMGCTVGQGISAASTLAFSAPVTLLGIGAGAAVGLHQLIIGFRRAAL